MKKSFILLASILAAPELFAQLVADGATNTLSNVTNTFTGDVTVGTNGSFTLLVLSDNVLLTNTANGIIGRNLTAKSNEVRLVGSTARWRMGGTLFVGSNGPASRLVISNGALLESSRVWVGNNAASSSNEVVVIGPGSTLNSPNGLLVGADGNANRLTILNGGQVFANLSGSLVVIGFNEGVKSNSVVVCDPGSRWSVNPSLFVGSAGNGNTLVVSNGALVDSVNGVIGAALTASNNLAIVTGVGTVWSNSGGLRVGDIGPGSQLIVSNGGSVIVGGSAYVGATPFFSSSNRVTLDGGALRVTNATASGLLDVRRGTLTLNSGLLEVDQLLVTNTVSFFEFNSGTFAVHNSTVNSGVGLGLRVGNGVNPATLFLTGSGTNTVGGTCTISSNALLAGNGRLVGAMTVQAEGTISPGASIGKISLSVTPTLQGTISMEISKNGSSLTNDQIEIAGPAPAISYGGVLSVTNIGPTPVSAGDRFQLFSANAYSGGFTTVSLPPLGLGLRWTTNLLLDGSIEVQSLAPAASTLPASNVSQAAATLNGLANPNGTDAIGWFEYGFSTNYGFVTAPQPLGSGNTFTNFSQAITGLIPIASYHFRAVASNSFGVARGADESFPDLAQRDYVKSIPSQQFYNFGSSAAISGDTFVIKDVYAYVFARSGNSWTQQATLVPGCGTSTAGVAISGDTVVAGSPCTVPNQAYVFVRNGSTWTRQAVLTASNGETFDNFGTSLAISGDTLVVGAPSEASDATGVNGDGSNNNAGSSGAAYVFVRSGTNWTQQAYLKASNTRSGNLFGTSVAAWGDTVVVSAQNEESGATGVNGNQSQTNNVIFRSGAAYVFVRNGTTWTQQAYLKASNTGNDDHFGGAIALAGDTLVVGATNEDSNATGVNGAGTDPNANFNSGAAYVFVRNGSTWTQQAYLKASNTATNGLFGTSVTVSGDSIVVGAKGDASNATGVDGDGANKLAPGAGAAYVFKRVGTTWSFRRYLKASNTESNDLFGASVAVSDEFVIVGAPGEDSNAVGLNGDQDNNSLTNAGAAYIFGTPLPPFAEINVSQSNTNIFNGGTGQLYLVAGTNVQDRSFTIKNTGSDFLTGLGIDFDGPDAAMFTLSLSPAAPLTPASNTLFTVRFAPTRTGTNIATLHISSNDTDENPFNIQLKGVSLSFTEDRDGDGLNDATEFLLSPLGFNFQSFQPGLVNALFNNLGGAISNLNTAGFFTQTQLQALSVDSPLLARDPNTGLFKLTIGVERSTDLSNFFPFPMAAPQTIINAEGKLEFEFSAPGNAAFFRLEGR